jgi:Flp pilus assembly pilin Flp
MPAHRLTGRKVDMRITAELLKGEQGQDLVEYTLLLAFVMMASAAMYVNAGGSVTGIWTVTNTQLNSGIVAAGS